MDSNETFPVPRSPAAAEPTLLVRLDDRAFRGVRRRVDRRAIFGALAAALLIGAGALAPLWWMNGGTRVAVGAHERSLRFALRSGDALLAAPGSELTVVAQEPAHRQVRVLHGEALFDVQRLRAGERFEVETEHARLSVRGTVFTVVVELGRTVVRAYQGRVTVNGQAIDAGRSWASSGMVTPGGDELAEEAEAAARTSDVQPQATVKAPATRSARPVVSTLSAPDGDMLAVAASAFERHDAVGALELLDTYALDDDRSPQRERATVLRIDALLALGQPEAARVHALRYLSREPETATSGRLRALLSSRQGEN